MKRSGSQKKRNTGGKTSFIIRAGITALLLALILCMIPMRAGAGQVVSTADSGPETLRQVIADASTGETVTFDSSLTGQTITLTSGQLVINENLTIDGESNSITVRGNNSSHIFSVGANTTLNLNSVTVADGRAAWGGAILLSDSTATLNASDCTFLSNVSIGEAGNGSSGAICKAKGTLSNCTFSGNSAEGSAGAITVTEGSLTVKNCTFVGNIADSNNDGNGVGGAIYVSNSASLTMTNTLVADNKKGVSTPDDVYQTDATITSSYNIVEAPTGSYTATGTGDITGEQAGLNLGSLDENGGSTQTFALLEDSPAINAGTGTGLTTDQRGEFRVGAYDIGAYEFQGPTVTTTAVTSINKNSALSGVAVVAAGGRPSSKAACAGEHHPGP